MKKLDDIPKNVFKIPIGYFEELPLKIEQKINTENEILTISKENVFTVSDRYFDQLALKIQNRIQTQTTTNYLPTWNKYLVLKYALPSVILSIIIAFYFSTNSNNNWQAKLKNVTSEHLVAFLNESEATEIELIEAAHFDERDLDLLNLEMHSGLVHDEINHNELQNDLENEL